MNCEREAEVWRAIEARHWPERCDEELRAHVAACESCADLTEVASVLVEECDEAVRTAHVPSSGVVWFRAQMRLRQDAARTVRRTISAMQAAAIFIAVAGVAFVVNMYGGFASLADTVGSIKLPLSVGVALALPLVVLLAPVAVYFAVSKD
jgi:hypothetical protein